MNDPVNLVDPLGLACITVQGGPPCSIDESGEKVGGITIIAKRPQLPVPVIIDEYIQAFIGSYGDRNFLRK